MTQERLKELVKYNKETGIFTHNVSRGGKKVGEYAGHVNNKHHYLELTLDGKKQKGHRMAYLYVLGKIPIQINHKDQNRNNNKWSNIEPSNAQHNMKCKSKYKSNTTGITGVYKHANGKYQARISINGKAHTS